MSQMPAMQARGPKHGSPALTKVGGSLGFTEQITEQSW